MSLAKKKNYVLIVMMTTDFRMGNKDIQVKQNQQNDGGKTMKRKKNTKLNLLEAEGRDYGFAQLTTKAWTNLLNQSKASLHQHLTLQS